MQPDGYSQVVTVTGPAKRIFLGGKAGIYPDQSCPDTLEEQFKLTFENIRRTLEAAGATPADVVEIQIVIVDLANVDPTPVYRDVRNFFPVGHKPASMAIGVSALAYPGLLVEINVTALGAAWASANSAGAADAARFAGAPCRIYHIGPANQTRPRITT